MQNKAVLFKQHARLLFIVLANFLASILHYVHNIMYFEHYPEPDWLAANVVDYFWFIMTFVGLYALICLAKQRIKHAIWLLYLYATMNMLSVLHYAVDSDNVMTTAMHVLIWLETVVAIWLIIFVAKTRLATTN